MSQPIPHWLRPEALEAIERNRRTARARRDKWLPKVAKLLAAGMTLRGIGAKLGIAPSNVARICTENGLKYEVSKGGFVTDQPWQVADVSELTDEDREAACRYGIAMPRFAWLKSCPKLTARTPRHG